MPPTKGRYFSAEIARITCNREPFFLENKKATSHQQEFTVKPDY